MTWDEAAELLEVYLEDAARIVDGQTDRELPEIPQLDLDGIPTPETEARIRALLADAEEAMALLAIRKAAMAQEITRTKRLKVAGAGYLRNVG